MEKYHNPDFIKYTLTLNKLSKVQSTRNKFAHRILNVSDEAIERFKQDGTVGLVQFVDKPKPQERLTLYKPEEEDKIMTDVVEVHDWLESFVS